MDLSENILTLWLRNFKQATMQDTSPLGRCGVPGGPRGTGKGVPTPTASAPRLCGGHGHASRQVRVRTSGHHSIGTYSPGPDPYQASEGSELNKKCLWALENAGPRWPRVRWWEHRTIAQPGQGSSIQPETKSRWGSAEKPGLVGGFRKRS